MSMDKEYEQLLIDFCSLQGEYKRTREQLFILKELLFRIQQFYPGQFEEVITKDELKDLTED